MGPENFVQYVAILFGGYIADPTSEGEGGSLVARFREIADVLDLSVDKLEAIVGEIKNTPLAPETIKIVRGYFEDVNQYLKPGDSLNIFNIDQHTKVAQFYAEVITKLRALSIIEGKPKVEEMLWKELGRGLIAEPKKMVSSLNAIMDRLEIVEDRYKLPQPSAKVQEYMEQRGKCLINT